jgi:hypothetical protein
MNRSSKFLGDEKEVLTSATLVEEMMRLRQLGACEVEKACNDVSDYASIESG